MIGDIRFKCQWCDYIGMNGLQHVRELHPSRRKEFDDMNAREYDLEKVKMFEEEQEKLTEQQLDGIRRMELANRFTYHKPDQVAIDQMILLRNLAGHLANNMMTLVPDGREQERAISAVEEAIMWANAGIARQYAFDDQQPDVKGGT